MKKAVILFVVMATSGLSIAQGFDAARFRAKTTSGAVLTPIGLLAVSGALYCKYRTVPDPFAFGTGNNYDLDGYNKANKRYNARVLAPLITGCVSAGAGIILLAVGLKQRSIYFRQGSASVGLSDNGLGVAFNF